ncbi:hypothetical protein [Campylobacter sp.]|uniref:hypothetical protein n=1 Tax=Campylobacter sp. TaxID=205 RepID=UPI002AA6F849|nr:hypothetical protein [Campylobacter sp.]MCI6661852.1 hypothetical protein [Campylobacter sp.]
MLGAIIPQNALKNLNILEFHLRILVLEFQNIPTLYHKCTLMKLERYKVKSIDEVAEFQKQNGTIPPLKEANKAKEYNLINATKEQITQKLQNGFSTKEREFYILGKTSIFGSEKRLILSSDTIQSHTHHEEITANEYAKIPDIIKQKLHIYNSKQDKNRKIIMANYDNKNYKLVLKNIGKKDENFAAK